MVWRIMVLAGFLAAAGCSGCRPRFEPVGADFRRLALEEMKRGTVELELANPNRFAVDINELRYVLLLGSDTVALGRRGAPVHLGAQDSTRAEFPFELRVGVSDILARLPGLLADTAVFKLTGRYSLPSVFRAGKLPFTYSRVVPLAEQVRSFTKGLDRLFDRKP